MDLTDSCTFYVLKAEWLRNFEGRTLPFFSEIRTKQPDALVEVTISWGDVVKGKYAWKILAVSHRWMKPDSPDPDGAQLKFIQEHLASSKAQEVEYVWIDAQCMPQDHPKGSRSTSDTAAFKTMLAQMNMIYLGTAVLILYDQPYKSRFWTQFEAWLSMQHATLHGLKSAVRTPNARHTIVCIKKAAEQEKMYDHIMIEKWANKTPEEAHDFLAKADVTVTNASDKKGQLPKIAKLSETVRRAFEAVAESMLRQVEAGVAGARDAQEAHQLAISRDLMTMVMEREKEAKRQGKEAGRMKAILRAQTAKARCSCCVCDSGAYIYPCRVPTKYSYVLPCCLHVCLCPQQRCDPQCEGEGQMANRCLNICCLNFLVGYIGAQSTDHWQTAVTEFWKWSWSNESTNAEAKACEAEAEEMAELRVQA